MVLEKRYCIRYDDGSIECFSDSDGFWYTDKGIIIKWVIVSTLFLLFMGWFVGGYMHAKARLRKGQPLLAYHRFLISYSERKRHGQVPQNHFTFYAQPHPYQQQPYPQRQDGAYAEPPPMYANNDAPPQYFAPPAASKVNANQQGPTMEMPPYQARQPYAAPQGVQQSGVVGGSSGNGDLEQGQGRTQELPPRPQQAKAALRGFVERFRK